MGTRVREQKEDSTETEQISSQQSISLAKEMSVPLSKSRPQRQVNWMSLLSNEENTLVVRVSIFSSVFFGYYLNCFSNLKIFSPLKDLVRVRLMSVLF